MTAGDRYVTTADIRAALMGRETELIDTLNIAWRDGKPHIACPSETMPTTTRHGAGTNGSARPTAPVARATCSAF
jgi:hypothetical protein